MGSRTRAIPPGRQRSQIIGSQLQKLVGGGERVEAPQYTALTAQDEVLIKDTWNKFVAWKHIGMEAFVSRLYQEDESIAVLLGDLGDEVEDIFFGLFDLCVRRLQPHTEHLGREAACPMHMDPSIEWKSLDEYAVWFAKAGLTLSHWGLIRAVWQWALAQSPILEAYEETELQRGEESAFHAFVTGHIMVPMHQQIDALAALLTDDAVARARAIVSRLCEDKAATLAQLGADPRLDGLAPEKRHQQLEQWLDATEEWLQTYPQTPTQREALREWGYGLMSLDVTPTMHDVFSVALLALVAQQPWSDGETEQALPPLARLLSMSSLAYSAAARHEQALKDKAEEWLRQMADERDWPAERLDARLAEIFDEIRDTGAYAHTFEELEYGARVAWRNAYKCIGRVNWNKMIIRDKRDVVEPDAMFQEVLEHLNVATAGENVEIVMTVFRAKEPLERWGPRFWNTQYVRYAAYEQPDGSIIGDPANLSYTRQVMAMGWESPTPQTAFDQLPHVIHVPGQPPAMFELPSGAAAEVLIEHPDIPEFASLGLRWCAIPVVCNIGLDLGGIRYTCVPFNGWFMGSEIARDLFDGFRYDKAEAIAALMGLDTSSEQTLWRDRAFVELNVAILHSFRKARVTLVDHHTASRQFLTHDRREKQAGRECPARWSWIVPPLSGSATDVFHHEMREFHLEPKYRELSNRWEVETLDLSLTPKAQQHDASATTLLILFGSETGTAENFAYQAGQRLQRFRPTVKALNDCIPQDLDGLDMLLVITSTCGDGDLPQNAEGFARWLEQQPDDLLAGTSYGVMGLGNSIYEHYCAAGVYFNQLLQQKGAHRFIPLHKGDELRGQLRRFTTWLERIGRVLQVDAPTMGYASNTPKVTWLETPPESLVPLQTRSVWATVEENTELLDTDDPGRSTRHIIFNGHQAGLSYEAGDHLSVYPVNDDDEVDALCDALGIAPDAWFTVEGSQMPFAVPAMARRVLAEELDVSLLAPCQKLLELLHQSATDPEEQAQLEALAQAEASPSAQTPHPTAALYESLSGLLRAFPTARPDFGQLLAVLPRLKPRLYSISSSPWLHPDHIHLTVGVLRVETGKGTWRPGLCSHYLAGLKPGDTARVLVRPSEFCPPDDLSVPMLLVGPGTGIAPLRGFLQHRQAWLASPELQETHRPLDGESLHNIGPAWLYFGCRDEGESLYRHELEHQRQDGVLNRLEVAYSRVGKRKQYVQHKMRRQHKTLWRLIADPRCHIYICGDTQMADDVLNTLIHIAQTTGQLPPEDAQAMFAKMKRERRYLTDVWTSVVA